MLSDYDLDDMVKTIPAESITSTDDVDCYEVCSKNIKKQWNEYYGTNDFPKEIKKVTQANPRSSTTAVLFQNVVTHHEGVAPHKSITTAQHLHGRLHDRA